jgi:hypothetical protein
MVHPVHQQLRTPLLGGAGPLAQVAIDLTVYLNGPSVEEFDHLVRLYERICPVERLQVYAMAETVDWDLVRDPMLTKRGLEAAARGERLPFLAPVRRRIERGRTFEFQFWDEREVESFSFTCRRIKDESTGDKYSFVRFLFPLDVDLHVLQQLAEAIADSVELCSGHGGLTFLYDPWNKYDAFSVNYGRAKRFWGIDVEDLNLTLPLTSAGIKGAQWLTVVGRSWMSDGAAEAAVGDLRGRAEISVLDRKHAVVIRAGETPSDGDQHRQDPELDPYFEVGRALAPITMQDHPDFRGDGFLQNANTIGWLRRFIEPDGWR